MAGGALEGRAALEHEPFLELDHLVEGELGEAEEVFFDVGEDCGDVLGA